VEYVSSAAQFR